jgi:hypothetical protein
MSNFSNNIPTVEEYNKNPKILLRTTVTSIFDQLHNQPNNLDNVEINTKITTLVAHIETILVNLNEKCRSLTRGDKALPKCNNDISLYTDHYAFYNQIKTAILGEKRYGGKKQTRRHKKSRSIYNQKRNRRRTRNNRIRKSYVNK